MFDFIAIQEGCYGTFWGPCFCPDDSRTCAACQNAKRLNELGLDWEEWYEKVRVDNWKHIDKLMAVKD